MQLNKVLKGLIIALPIMTITACSSTKQVDEQAQANADSQQTQSSSNMDDMNNNNVEVGSVERTRSPEEIRQEKMQELATESTIYFDFDKSGISYDAQQTLAAHANFLTENPNMSVIIEGHCDERGTPEYNIALGERRAKAVSNYLQTLGVSNSQITMVSYGEEKPVDMSRTDSGFAKNRRAILVYTN